MLAPIALFVYNRPWHTRQTVEALQKNPEAAESDLIIYSDAPKSEAQEEKVRQVRAYIKSIGGFKSVSVVEREVNYGLARSIIEGVAATLGKYGRIIVLEDDMVTSTFFLSYMNGALRRFAGDERVISIHGYTYPVKQHLPEAFFLLGADCWGWATWSRGWAFFNGDGQSLLNDLLRRGLTHEFDYDGAYPFTKMLQDQIAGRNDSWAVRWYASAFLAGKLTLYPGRSLVHNIGNEKSGTHSGHSPEMDVILNDRPINMNDIDVEPCQLCRRAFEGFFRQAMRGRWWRLARNMRDWMLGK